MKAAIILILCFLPGYTLSAQVVDSFPDETLHLNPAWYGNTTLFLNREESIQLHDPQFSGKGRAWLGYHAPLIPGGTRNWTFRIALDFSPSPSNYARFYFQCDHPDPALVRNGYFLQMGGISGDQDALQLFEIRKGVKNLVLEGYPGSVAAALNDIRISLSQDPDGMWELRTAYFPQDSLQLETISRVPSSLSGGPYSAFLCQYTSTRSGAFRLSQFGFGPAGNDDLPPELLAIESLSNDSTILRFDEPIHSPPDAGQVDLAGSSIALKKAERQSGDPRALLLIWESALESGREYQLTVGSVSDLAGNRQTLLPITFEHLPSLPPEAGQLVINEILFNPLPDGEDYVELFNASGNALDLSDLRIRNHNGDERRPFSPSSSLLPGEYLVLTPDTEGLASIFPSARPGAMHAAELPSLPDKEGSISLWRDDILLDEAAYREEMHSPWLVSHQGVALERVLASGAGNDPSNWHSAASSAGYGTPTLPNSQAFLPDPAGSAFDIARRVFSPDGDGREDFLLIRFRAAQPGSMVSIRIFDANGRPVRILTRNMLAGAGETLQWDGTGEDGRRARLGIYLLVAEVFNDDGSAQMYRDYCVLASPPGP